MQVATTLRAQLDRIVPSPAAPVRSHILLLPHDAARAAAQA